MGKYITRRVLQMIPLMIGISLIVFLIIQAAPGGPENMMLQSGLTIDQRVIEAYRHRLGVDQPIYIQYFRWISAALSGDLGISYITARLWLMILERLPATLELMAVSFILAACIAIPMGIYSALHQYSPFDMIGHIFLIFRHCHAGVLVWLDSPIGILGKIGVAAGSRHSHSRRRPHYRTISST